LYFERKKYAFKLKYHYIAKGGADYDKKRRDIPVDE